MEIENFEKAKKGHWVLAKMGKKVLRPGGKELTLKLIENMRFSTEDDVVEFAPGLGLTAKLCLKKNPKSYIGIDEEESIITDLKKRFTQSKTSFIRNEASKTGLVDASVNKVFGEAMLTMHSDNQKSKIIKEAHRILKKGGFYGIHELGLLPNNLNDTLKSQIQKEIAVVAKVNARPLTQSEWTNLLTSSGFEIISFDTNAMNLLKPSRILDDEGLIQYLKIAFNFLKNPMARKRILEMRRVFKKYETNMNAIAIIARKI